MAQPIHISNSWNAVRDHSRQRPDFTYVYAVISRRSAGLSLGVNLNPDKVCNFDCLYCEVDRTAPPRTRLLDVPRMTEELTALVQLARSGALASEPRFAGVPEPVTRTIRDIAFSGDGEPTMVPNFAACVEAVASVRRSQHLDDTRLVLITDAAGLDKADVRRGIAIMDANNGEVWAKLDAGTEPYYRLVNRTHIRFDRILRNILLTAQVRPIIVQSLFLRVHGQPMPPAELDAYCERLNQIIRDGARIQAVHAYTVARPTADAAASALDPATLESFASRIRQATSLNVLTFP